MRRSAENKEKSRQLILETAARLFREKGIENTSVNDIMHGAGMTHGGFYRHFRSKDELAAQAIEKARLSVLSIFSGDASKAEQEMLAYLDLYLSDDHVNSPEKGCPLTLFSVEASRGPASWQSAIEESIKATITHLRAGKEKMSERDALELVSTIVGAVILSRAVGASQMSQGIIAASRDKIDTLRKARRPAGQTNNRSRQSCSS